MKYRKIRAIISGGGTGGHIFPALSIADKLKELNKGSDLAAIKAATEEVQQAFYKVSEKLYQQTGAQGGCDPNCGGSCGNDGVVDADYETVD